MMVLLVLGALTIAAQLSAIVVAWRAARAARRPHAWRALAGLCTGLALLGLLGVLPLGQIAGAAVDLAMSALILIAVIGVRRLLRGLHAMVGQQSIVAELGLRALAGLAPQPLLEACTEAVARALDVPLVKVLRWTPDGQRLRLQAGVGYDPKLIGPATIPTGSGSQAGFALASRTPVVVEDLRSETRFIPTPLLLEHGAVSGICMAIGPVDRPLGVLTAHSREARHFNPHEIDLVQAVANILASALERDGVEADRQRAEQALSALSRRLLTAREDERGRLAQALHDGIGQSLSLVKMDITSLRDPRQRELAATRLEADVENVDRAIRQVREMSLDLRPAILDDLGLQAALRWYLDRIPHGHPRAHLSIPEGDGKTLDPEVRTAVYRIVQEAITNVLRHAQARNVWVSLSAQASCLQLSVRDDGSGFDLEAKRRETGDCFGLSSMEERARLLGGRFEIQTAPGAGTEVRARFPAPA